MLKKNETGGDCEMPLKRRWILKSQRALTEALIANESEHITAVNVFNITLDLSDYCLEVNTSSANIFNPENRLENHDASVFISLNTFALLDIIIAWLNICTCAV